MAASGRWAYDGTWDPDTVEYEIDGMGMSELIGLLQSSKQELEGLKSREKTIEDAFALGAMTQAEKAESIGRLASLQKQIQNDSLRIGYLENKLKEMLGSRR